MRGRAQSGTLDRSVSLLIVLQNGGERSANRQTRAVQCVQEARLATAGGAIAKVRAARLEVAEVGAGADLALLSLSGEQTSRS